MNRYIYIIPKRYPSIFVGLLFAAVLLAGWPKTDYGVDGCSMEDPPLVEDFWKGPGETDVTFIAFGDSQFGGGAEDKNDLHVRAINAVEGALRWESDSFGFDEPVSRVRGGGYFPLRVLFYMGL